MDLNQHETNYISSQGEMLNFQETAMHGKHQSSESAYGSQLLFDH